MRHIVRSAGVFTSTHGTNISLSGYCPDLKYRVVNHRFDYI